MKKKILLFILMTLLRCVQAQPAADSITEKKIKVEMLTVEDGLSQGNITSIVQDKNGFMWFGTKDGLNKYDGYNFTVYVHDEKKPYSIAKNHITNLLADKRGFLWVFYLDGSIDVFNPETDKAYHIQNTLLKNEVSWQHAFLDANENLFLYSGHGFLKVTLIGKPEFAESDFKLKVVELTDFLPKKINDTNRVYFFISSKNEMYLSYRDSIFVYPNADVSKPNKIKRFSNKTFSQVKPSDNLHEGFEFVAAEDTIHHRLILIGYRAFTIYDETTGLKTDSAYNSIDLGNADVDNKGRIWFGGLGGGNIYDPAKKKLYKLLPLDLAIKPKVFGGIGRIYRDRSGTIWMGTNGYGIIKFNPAVERFLHIGNSQDGFSLNTIWDDYKAEKIWLRNFAVNIFLYDRKSEKLIKIPQTEETKTGKGFKLNADYQSRFNTFCIDKDGYWVLRDTSVVYFDKSWKLKTIFNLTYTHWIDFWELKPRIDNAGKLWLSFGIGSNAKLYKFDKDKPNDIKSYPIPHLTEAVKEYPLTSIILPDENNNLWLGTMGGLLFFNTTTAEWKIYEHSNTDSASLPMNQIYTLCKDQFENNILWVGTKGGGLTKFNIATGKCKTYTTENGLPNNVVYGILQDDKGNLWMSTNNGIAKSPLTPEGGIKSAEGEANSPLWSRGVFKNFTVKDGLQSNEFNRYAYCKLQTGELAFGGVNGLNIFNPDDINDNVYEPNILFTGFKIGNKEVSILEDSAILRKAIFATNQLHLNYTQNFLTFSFASTDYSSTKNNGFQYQLVGLDKGWLPVTKLNEATYTNLDPGSYTFKVRGTNSDGVWSSNIASINIFISPPWWATWWFRSLVAMAVAGAAYGFYRYRLMQALKIANVRNSIARDLHDEIGSTLSSIALYGASAKMMLPEEHPISNVLTKINESTSSMNESMSDIVWAINTRNDKFDNIVSRMEAFANQVMEVRACKVFFATNNEVKQLDLDMEQRKNVYLLYKEIVNNAGKHSSCKNLWVKLNLNNGFLNLNIKDDGKGFNTNETDAYAMGGNGLFNMKKRAAELHAEIKIDSTPGNGTEVNLKMRV